MKKRLTLTIKEDTIKLAKQYTHEQGISLSDLVEQYLKLITSQKRTKNKALPSSKVKILSGSVKTPGGFDYKKELGNSLNKKYKR